MNFLFTNKPVLAPHFKQPDAKARAQAVANLAVRDHLGADEMQIRIVRMPEPHVLRFQGLRSPAASAGGKFHRLLAPQQSRPSAVSSTVRSVTLSRRGGVVGDFRADFERRRHCR